MGRIVLGMSFFRLRRPCLRLRAVAVGAVAFLAVPGGAFAWESWHVDLPGFDYAAYCVSSNFQCRNLCLTQPQCRAFTAISGIYGRVSGLPDWMRNCMYDRRYTACFLKSQVPASVQKSNWALLHYYSGVKETRVRPRTAPRGCQWGNSITRPGQRGCFCWEGSYQVERAWQYCQGY